MNYDWMKYEDIEKFKYPNLLAEIKESGYSICTVADHMGIGQYVREDDTKTWNKLTGRMDILHSEVAGLMKLFGVEYDYLFSHDLSVMNEKPVAYWRWYDSNKRKKEELKRNNEISKIYLELSNDSEFLEFSKFCMSLTKEQRHEVVNMIRKGNIA